MRFFPVAVLDVIAGQKIFMFFLVFFLLFLFKTKTNQAGNSAAIPNIRGDELGACHPCKPSNITAIWIHQGAEKRLSTGERVN